MFLAIHDLALGIVTPLNISNTCDLAWLSCAKNTTIIRREHFWGIYCARHFAGKAHADLLHFLDKKSSAIEGRMPKSRIVSGSIDINVLLAFIFGVVFVIVMLIFSILWPNPSNFTQWVFITVLALAASGVGSVFPGMLGIESRYIKAGGALAMFVIVFATKPALLSATATIIEPKSSPIPVIEEYLKSIDGGNYIGAFHQMDEDAKSSVAKDQDQLIRIYNAARKPLGNVESRVEYGLNSFVSPQGYPIGAYRAITYKTKFSASPSGQCYLESVVVRATADLIWKVYNHSLNPSPIPC